MNVVTLSALKDSYLIVEEKMDKAVEYYNDYLKEENLDINEKELDELKNDKIKKYQKVLIYSHQGEFISINEVQSSKKQVKALRVLRIKS